ncbi:hypothetical protein X975_25912, partial [Stegodyphus mimosarum]
MIFLNQRAMKFLLIYKEKINQEQVLKKVKKKFQTGSALFCIS